MRIEARRIDPVTGEPDSHGIPQIACPGCRTEVNPQFTCRDCPCALELESHQAIDDRGDPFYLVDAVDCGFLDESRRMEAVERRFPNLLEGIVEGVQPRVEPGVICALLSWPGRAAPVSLEVDGAKWVPLGNCRSCQFYRGVEGDPRTGGVVVVCTAPEPPPSASSDGEVAT